VAQAKSVAGSPASREVPLRCETGADFLQNAHEVEQGNNHHNRHRSNNNASAD
jgi:hypothetical protein